MDTYLVQLAFIYTLYYYFHYLYIQLPLYRINIIIMITTPQSRMWQRNYAKVGLAGLHTPALVPDWWIKWPSDMLQI